jgi:hypothetical protein
MIIDEIPTDEVLSTDEVDEPPVGKGLIMELPIKKVV